MKLCFDRTQGKNQKNTLSLFPFFPSDNIFFFFGIVVSVFKNGLPFIVWFSGILSKLALILTTVSNFPEFIPLYSQSFKFKRIHGLNVKNLI